MTLTVEERSDTELSVSSGSSQRLSSYDRSETGLEKLKTLFELPTLHISVLDNVPGGLRVRAARPGNAHLLARRRQGV